MMMAKPTKYRWPDYLRVGGHKLACVYQDRLELEKEAEDNSKLRSILFNKKFSKERWFHDGQMFEDYVLPALFWKVVMHNGMAVIHFMGPSNGGKSYMAAATAHELLEYWSHYRGIEGKVWYFFSYAVALEYMDQFKKGDVVIIDEHSKQLGQDSASAAVRFNNMLRATRKRGVSYFVCDPDEQNLPNCNYMLRTAFYVEEIQMTRSLTYTGKTHRLDGLTDWEVPLDEPWFKEMIDEYEAEKDAYLAGFARRRGAADKGLRNKQMRMARDLLKMVQAKGLPEGKRGWVKRLGRYLTDLDYDHETFATRDQVIDRVMEKLKSGTDFDDLDMDFDFDGVVPEEEQVPYLGQTEHLRDAVLDRMVELGAKSQVVEAFRLVRDAIDKDEYMLEEQFRKWQELFPDVDITEDSFRIIKYYGMKNYSGAVKDGYGLAFEDVYSAKLESGGISHEKGGSNTPNPDIVILDENDEPIEVHSLKAFLNKQGYENYDYGSIADSEKALDLPIFLVVYSLACDTLFKIPVDANFLENGVRVTTKGKKSIRLPKGRPKTRKERTEK